jgi:3',5'-cyclic AMP phosphodiesterase CpdA
VVPESPRPLLGKRMLGWLSWRLRRSAIHRVEVLDALVEDLAISRPDQIAITGDLTNLSLESEFVAARSWLRRIGAPDRVTLVPGNHDCYVHVPRRVGWDLWSEYLASDANAHESFGEAGLASEGSIRFPSLRLRGPLALVGLSSAVPTRPFLASGEVGADQLAALERLLTALATTGLYRVVLIHHPPDPGATSARRGLRDAEALCRVLRRAGAELVLHGHLHRTRIGGIEGPSGPIPVLCVRSASDVGLHAHKRAQYHLIDFEATPAGRARSPSIRLRTRGWQPGARRFAEEGDAESLALLADSRVSGAQWRAGQDVLGQR